VSIEPGGFLTVSTSSQDASCREAGPRVNRLVSPGLPIALPADIAHLEARPFAAISRGFLRPQFSDNEAPAISVLDTS